MPAQVTQLIPALVRKGMLAVPLLTAALAAAACSATSSTTPSPPMSHTSAAVASGGSSAGSGVRIKTATTSLGLVLADGKGITVYLFEKDAGIKSTCYGACAAAWPPVLTTGEPVAGAGAKTALLGTTKRTDGKMQVTYAGHPLYYSVQSTKPG